jgi:hypothetical protein
MNKSTCRHGSLAPRYATNGKCIQCVAERGKKRQAAKTARNGNMRIGVSGGFIWFGSLYEKILRHIHTTGPASNADLREDLPGKVGISVALGRLTKHGFLYRVDYQASKPGVRGGYVFDLKPAKAKVAPAPPPRYESQKRYIKARPFRVTSVFDFRGRIDL